MFDKRTKASLQTLQAIKGEYGDVVWSSVIPIDTKFRDASLQHVPPSIYAPESRGSHAYGVITSYSIHYTKLYEGDAPDVSEEGESYAGLAGERFQSALAQCIDGLPEREALVLSLYYDEELNLKEIGQILSVSESRVSQIHSQAMHRVRARMKDWY